MDKESFRQWENVHGGNAPSNMPEDSESISAQLLAQGRAEMAEEDKKNPLNPSETEQSPLARLAKLFREKNEPENGPN